MLLSEPFASLITVFRTSLIKFYLNCQRMLDSFYHIHVTEFKRIKLKNKGPKHFRLAMFCNFCVGLRHDVKICTVRSMTS